MKGKSGVSNLDAARCHTLDLQTTFQIPPTEVLSICGRARAVVQREFPVETFMVEDQSDSSFLMVHLILLIRILWAR